MIQGVTRTWKDQPDSNLDHCWMNNPGRLVYFRNLERAFSDHNMILIQIRTKNNLNDRQEIITRDRKNYDKDDYKRRIAQLDWSEFHRSENLDIKNERNILSVLDEIAPVKTIQKRNKFRNWLSDGMKDEMKNRSRLRNEARVSNRLEDWRKYKQARNACVKSLRNCKRNFHEKLFEKVEQETTTKGLYRLTRELCGLKSISTPQQYISDGVVVRKPSQMVNLQLEYYMNKVSTLLQNIPTSIRNPHRFLDLALANWEEKDRHCIFKFREITLQETAAIISSLSESEALGHDMIDAIGIRDAGHPLLEPIRIIINMSLMKGKFCQKWKFVRITPTLKSKDLDVNSTSSYRPVVVLTAMSKLIERAAQKQILQYMETTLQMNPSNHMYRKYYSTATTMMEILDEIHQGSDDKNITSLMAINQSAAFDCVSKDLLLQKLDRYLIGKDARDWIEDYLTFRTQYVVIGAGQSVMRRVENGVPQGSVIGPLLYAIFTNELSETIKRPGCNDEAAL